MSPIQPDTELHLGIQHVLALRKAIAIAVMAAEAHPEDTRLTHADKAWLSQVERMLWPAWPAKPEARKTEPE